MMTRHATGITSPIRFARARHAALGALCAGFVLAGCENKGEDEPESPPSAAQDAMEQAPEPASNDQSSTSPASAPSSTPSGTDEAAPRPVSSAEPWTVPSGWTKDPEPRRMRLATYLAPDPTGPIEVAVTRFGGRVGGELANVNRWRGQMGLGPIGENELETVVTRFSAPGFDGYETRIESERGVMFAAGVYQDAIDQTWFVRASVPNTEAADRIHDDIFGMARSIAGQEQQ